ncbi:hypothetical protein VB715_11445 [Crocosphaera sp. UHCC 0190]|uniref:hypothetical protein n=1 Tax=Crocosphaera sp. UHCC 0190 TaxID=3110246 RepID=UPI002B1EECE2|nr:hypothetical protein [Crocosphaera sp. UHCC 0190]MEA5510379.1 hypothetical protein [Crocosphaera sp. UHCC 0190]
MLIPLISLILGIVLLGFAFLTYIGYPSFKSIPSLYRLKGNQFFVLGTSLIALTLALGIIGYIGYADASLLRSVRLVFGVTGIFLISFNWLRTIDSESRELSKLEKMLVAVLKFMNVKTILTFFSISILFSIFLISFFDGNYGGDAYMYHLPFAARLWGIITPEQYTFEYNIEHRFLGFPLLANWLQGLFWVMFKRPEATNLLAYSSLLIFIAYLRFYLKIPFYLASLTLLAVPMVQMHAARSYIDLPGNVGVSILILTTYLLYINKLEFNNKTFLLIFLSAGAAANTKFQLIPVVFIALLLLLPKIVSKYWQLKGNYKNKLIRASRTLFLCLLASVVIFITPIKNTVLYANPFYPVKVTIAGVVLNHNEAPPDFMHENIRKLPPHLRWGRSILEIDVFDKRRPWPWTLAMDFISWDEEKFGLGGYFGGYVIFNLILFIYLCWKHSNKESKTAIIIMVLMTGLTPLLPQAYELRYYMYWMMVFVALNCYLLCRLVEQYSQKFINPRNFALVATSFILIFVHKTNGFFTYPAYESLSKYMEVNVQEETFNKIKDGDKICLVGKAPHSFFYSSYFHPPRQYSLQSEFEMSPEYIEDKCQGRKILQ